MKTDLYEALKKLSNAGWIVRLRKEALPLPSFVKQRYPWLSSDLESFLCEIEMVCRNDSKLWLLSSEDFFGKSKSDFAWNEWELQSLDAADNDSEWISEIKQFWDKHFPIALSVADGYAYFAIREDNLIVYGREPEYEETEPFAYSLLEFLSKCK
jgi:hypothetical protein